jgi:hypothetical protein
MSDASQPQTISRWRGLLRDWGPRALFECVLIVFSIMLALGLSAWWQDLERKERVREAREYFIQEIEANRAVLQSDEYLPHHLRLAESLTGRWDAPMTVEQAQPHLAAFETGVHLTPFRDAVWRSFSTSGLMAYMPPEDVFALNDVYQAQDRLNLIHQGFYPVLSEMPGKLFIGSGDVRPSLISLQLYMNDVVGGEQMILQRYDAALEELRD